MPRTRTEIGAFSGRFERSCADAPRIDGHGGGGRYVGRGSARWRGVTEMYALYVLRYISGRNVSRNVPRGLFRAKCVWFPARNATGMRESRFESHSQSGKYREMSGTRIPDSFPTRIHEEVR